MKALLSKQPGGPETLLLEDVPCPEPGPGQLLLEVRAVGVNFFDVLIIEDKYQSRPPRPFAPGGELAGVVSAVGTSVAGFAVGDHVIAFCLCGGMAERIAVDAARCLLLPREIAFESAAAMLVTYGTALYALEDKGGLRSGETLLVLGASGGVGLAAIEIGKALGARVVAAASTQEKLDLALRQGADAGVVYPSGPLDQAAQKRLADAFKAACGGVATVVCDCVGGDYAEPALRATGWGGRYLIVGFAAGVPRLPFTLPLVKGSSLIGVFWGEWAMRDPAGFRHAAARLVGMLQAGAIHPHVSRTLPLAEGGAAIRALAQRASVGKVVVTIPP